MRKVGELPYEKRFHFKDGTAAKNLRELKEKIETISYDEFYEHANPEKNDFANWVEHVLNKPELAEKLRRVASIVETVELLNDELYPVEHKVEQKGAGEDLQERIEEELFSTPPPSTPPQAVSATGRGEEKEEPLLPSKEELEAERKPGPRVTTNEPPHTPITEKKAKPREAQLHLLVREVIYGLIIGLIAGFILGRIISL